MSQKENNQLEVQKQWETAFNDESRQLTESEKHWNDTFGKIAEKLATSKANQETLVNSQNGMEEQAVQDLLDKDEKGRSVLTSQQWEDAFRNY
ncbi:hypothetical protein ABE244_19525 [Bacillus toyonensis]|uniref:hypothetical protein n=1 Tax=Bacillus toyonensis TaxID=155322 RepID=UPI003D236528